MCGRYTLIASAEAIRLLFDLPAFDERLVTPRYNIAPTQPILLVMALSAFSGAAAVVNGVLIFLGQIKLETLDTGIFGSLLTNGVIGIVSFLVLGVVALFWQIRDVGSSITSIDRSSYRY